ncbi:ABC transporter ATP-binding protein [Tenuibacillus multivorans]|uniref:Peptide/nickel transport system ATP-binding protein n=1 Tax=Tenuibacillus multivorans TaxID=237069 RepID=A0A1H0C540_9BACI|nr:ABC transporter ATP-binding protein [Tenuibacillus multivorans]GEL77768.1 oligopeptide transport ATP-binding protein AppD [Tenuibacillus multivorans]SDN52959.1 peptide/nickel transport system ATP-binding protein [Tenuibacillus multivorans]
MKPLLDINRLNIDYQSNKKEFNIIKDINIQIDEKMKYGIVGESGSGKSLTSLAILNLLPDALKVDQGHIKLNTDSTKDLITLSKKEMRKIRGNDIAMIFQEPMTALDPVYTIEYQLLEVLKIHKNYSKKEMHQKGLDMLNKVGISRSEQIMKAYPHELSGGMRQRVMIAMALICEPKLLIADEPTTALDVTIQAQILDLMNDLSESHHTAILMITHDLGVILETCERVAVMYAGQIVEESTVENIFEEAAHPYTKGLLSSIQSLGERSNELYSIPGNVPTPDNYQELGCRFATRCPFAMDKCYEQEPPMFEVQDDHASKCWLHVEEAQDDERRTSRAGS